MLKAPADGNLEFGDDDYLGLLRFNLKGRVEGRGTNISKANIGTPRRRGAKRVEICPPSTRGRFFWALPRENWTFFFAFSSSVLLVQNDRGHKKRRVKVEKVKLEYYTSSMAIRRKYESEEQMIEQKNIRRRMAYKE